jgi:hypothetical protein
MPGQGLIIGKLTEKIVKEVTGDTDKAKAAGTAAKWLTIAATLDATSIFLDGATETLLEAAGDAGMNTIIDISGETSAGLVVNNLSDNATEKLLGGALAGSLLTNAVTPKKSTVVKDSSINGENVQIGDGNEIRKGK